MTSHPSSRAPTADASWSTEVGRESARACEGGARTATVLRNGCSELGQARHRYQHQRWDGMALFSKNHRDQLPQTFVPEAPPNVGQDDLRDATSLMDQWDRSLGNSDATWDCIEQVARRGGFKGSQAALFEVMD